MIVREFFKTRKEGVNLFKTYSDNDFMIKKVETGILYDEAIDVEDSQFTYIETDIRKEETDD